MNHIAFKQKIRITGSLFFETAFRIGSGREGELAVDMGVLKDKQGMPVLPGSTLKGNFRSTAERLADYLGFSACLLDHSLSGVNCVSDQEIFKKIKEEFKGMRTEKQRIDWVSTHTCDICRLFGSPVEASRIFFSDGILSSEWSSGFEIRDGVVIDRDSETAIHGLKYDFEVAPRNTKFDIRIDMDNPSEGEQALVGAVIAEWEAGFRLGGFTSRGLGQVYLIDAHVHQVDYTNPEHMKAYLLTRLMQPADNMLSNALSDKLNQKGGDSC